MLADEGHAGPEFGSRSSAVGALPAQTLPRGRVSLAVCNIEFAGRSGSRSLLRAILRCGWLLLGIVFAVTAHAQTLYKCQNASGNIEYSDRPCWSGSEVKRMTPTGGPTREDIERARMRAAADQQRAAEQKRQEAQERAKAQAPAAGAGAPSGASPGQGPGDEKVLTHDRSGGDRKLQRPIAAEEAAHEQGRRGWDTPTRSGQLQAEADRAYRNEKARMPAPVVPNQAPIVPSPVPSGPAVVTTCDAGGCWDASGRRYTSSGPLLIRNDGKACQQVGSTVTCN